MPIGFTISIFLGQTKVDQINNIRFILNADQEIVWFDISVDEISGMHEFNSRDHLISQHQNSFQREFRLQRLKGSARLGPRRSMTITLHPASGSYQ